MTATRIIEQGDGSSMLETIDFRSEFAFDEFSEWVVETLQVHPSTGLSREEMEPFTFDWRGSTFEAAWTDENGCFIKAPPGAASLLRDLQSALSQ